MNNTPLVSIIIPTYNRAHLIGETLDSVLAQTYTNWECIIVDDGSTDNTDDVVGSYLSKDSRFQYYLRPKDRLKGANACRNYGFELSKGDYINWFDSDDLMMPEKIERQVHLFLNSPNINLCLCSCLYFKGNIQNVIGVSNVIVKTSYGRSKRIFGEFVSKKIAITCQEPLWKRDFLSKYGGFNEETLRGQEYEYYSELLFDIDDEYSVVEMPLLYVRLHDNNITTNHYNGDENSVLSYFKVLRKVLGLITKLNNKEVYVDFLKHYLKQIIFCVRIKKYNLALDEIRYLINSSLKKYFFNTFKFLKIFLLIKIIALSEGKLYYKLKIYIK